MLMLVASAAQTDGIGGHQPRIIRAVRGVAIGADQLLMGRIPKIRSQIRWFDMAAQTHRALLSLQQRGFGGGVSIMANSAFALLEIPMFDGFGEERFYIFMAAEAEGIDRLLEGIPALGFLADMASLAAIFGEGRVLQRHHQAGGFRSMRIMAGRAIRPFQVAAFVNRHELRIDLMAFRAQRIIIFAHQSLMIPSVRFVTDQAFARRGGRVFDGIGQPRFDLRVTLAAKLLHRGFELVGEG
jgi:hypothetical protein